MDEKASLLPVVVAQDGRPFEEKKAILSNIPTYVPSFEGLRGLSVVFVHIYHIVPAPMKRVGRIFGTTGLDTFFVLSGFLVTGVLVGQQVSYFCRMIDSVRLLKFFDLH